MASDGMRNRLHGRQSRCPGLADAVPKAISGFDREQAYEALKQSAMLGERGMDLRMKYGYIPCDLFNEAVAYDMEYALADWAVAQVAKELGKDRGLRLFPRTKQILPPFLRSADPLHARPRFERPVPHAVQSVPLDTSRR